MNILVWNECYISGGADWSLIDLINNWPNESDNFTICVNKSHEGYSLIKKKIKKSKILTFNSILDDKVYKFCCKIKNKIIRGILIRFLLIYVIFIKFQDYKKLIRKIDVDLLLINNGGYPGATTSYIVAIYLKFFKKINSYMIVRNYPQKHYRKSIDMYIFKIISNYCIKKIITVSDSLKSSMIEMSGFKKEKIFRIYNGISIKNKFNKNFIKNYSDKSVGIIGSLEERKGHKLLFKAWAKVIKTVPNCKLYVVGSQTSGDKENLISYAKQLKIESSIIWMGYQSEIANVYNNLNIVVMPSIINESFGRVAIEAMAFNTPIIASKTGGLKEIITHNYDGMLFENNNHDQLSYQIIELLKNEQKCQFLINNGLNKFKNYFTAHHMANEYLNFIKNEK